MTAAETARVLRRWWWLAVLPLLASVGLASVLATGPQYYTTRTEFVFLAPGSAAVAGLRDGVAETLVNFAGAVQRSYAADHPLVDVSSPTASLSGNNVRRGASVALANAGNQWQASFNRPVLVVQVIDTSPERVTERLGALASEIAATAEELQSAAGAAPEDRITLEAPVDGAAILSFGPTRSGAVKGGVAVVVAGAIVGLTLATLAERLLPSRAEHRP